jgi:hypothetical protein
VSTEPQKHLWEYDHPYYCREGNFYKRDHHTLYGSWDEFVASAPRPGPAQ